jgi:hypothetical protein
MRLTALQNPAHHPNLFGERTYHFRCMSVIYTIAPIRKKRPPREVRNAH